MTDEDEIIYEARERILRTKEVNKKIKELNNKLTKIRDDFNVAEDEILSELYSIELKELEKLASLLNTFKYLNCDNFSCLGEIVSCNLTSVSGRPTIIAIIKNWVTPFMFSTSSRESFIDLDRMNLFEPCSERDYKLAVEKLFKDKADDK
jgi:hypothetical protein